MIKAVYLATYNDEMTIEEARDYHLNVHAPLGARIPGMRKYTIGFPSDPEAVEFDTLVESTYDDETAMEEALATPEGEEAVADIPNLTDPETMEMSLVEETVVLNETDPEESMVQLVYRNRWKEGMDDETARKHQTDVHQPLVARIPGLLAYTVSYPVDREAVEFDVLAEVAFSDAETMNSAMASPEAEAAFADLETFVDVESIDKFAVELTTIVDETVEPAPSA